MKRKRKPSVIVIILLILLISLAFMVLVSEFTISIAGNELRDRALEDCRADMGYISEALYSQLTAIQMQNIDILNNESVLALAMRSSILDKYEIVTYESAIIKLIRSKLMQYDLIHSAQLYIPTIGVLITTQKAAGIAQGELAEIIDIITAFPNGLYYTDEYMGFWSASPLVYSAESAESSRVMLTRIRSDSLSGMLRDYGSRANGCQLLLTVGGHIVAQSHDDVWTESDLIAADRDVTTVRRDGGLYYMIRTKHAFGDLSVYAVLPVDNVMSGIYRLQKMLKILEISCVFAIVLATFAFYHMICRPLKRVSVKMQQVGEGDLNVRMAEEKTAELNDVGRTFNSTVEHLRLLIDREYKSRLLAMSAEKKALQYQISPHFLYNTYFQLRNLILLEENEQAGRLADLMGRYLRYIVHQDAVCAALGEEMEHARNYADIQSMRFKGRIEVRYNVEGDDWQEVIVPRLLLQPLLENAFAHGLKDMEKDGLILLSLKRCGDAIVISVEDNGDGFDDAMPDKLARSVESGPGAAGESVALTNIHRRLRLHFGERSGLQFGRSDMGGLKVTIRIEPGKT